MGSGRICWGGCCRIGAGAGAGEEGEAAAGLEVGLAVVFGAVRERMGCATVRCATVRCADAGV